MSARARKKHSRARRSRISGRTVFVGTGIGVVAGFLGMRFGPELGYPVLLVAGAIGAFMARNLSGVIAPQVAEDQPDSQSERKAEGGGSETDSEVATQEAPVDAATNQPTRVSLFTEPGRGEPDWPVETEEVRLKLDLAKEYLDAEHPELANDMLQEVFDLEVHAARKLAVEILRESEEHSVAPGETARNAEV
jgi:hypothetical protein